MSQSAAIPIKAPLTASFPIGRVSALTGLSVRAIRFYGERGLVAGVRDARGNRAFDAAALDRLMMIAELRAADIGLKEISALLAPGDLPKGMRLHRLLKTHHDRRRTQLATLEAIAKRAGLALKPQAAPQSQSTAHTHCLGR